MDARPQILLEGTLPMISWGLAAGLLSSSAVAVLVAPTGESLGISEHFPKQVDVFGVPIHGSLNVSEQKLMHAASVLAQYLDNDADGRPDDRRLVATLVAHDARVFMAQDRDELDAIFERLEADRPGVMNLTAWHVSDAGITDPDWVWQDLAAEETRPGGGGDDDFDGALEEILHLISHVGLARTYPSAFAEVPGSRLAEAMDASRGGQFLGVPERYPAGAQYSYDDETCVYQCQATEYFYWALTSLLGAQSQPGRLAQIGSEWRLNTPAKLRSGAPEVHALLTDPQYNLPTVLPDGRYTGASLSVTPVSPAPDSELTKR